MQLKTRIEQSLKDPLKALAFELWYDHHMTEKEVSEQCIIEGIENIYRIKLMNYIRDFKIEEDY